MKFLGIKLSNYRIHQSLEVRFDPALTLIGGPNESGKSTLVEATYNALFLRSRRTGSVLKHMQSNAGGHPEIELCFEADNQTFTLNKIFRGTSGSTRLQSSTGVTWSQDDAESKVFELCGIGDFSAHAIPSQWDHLWIRQGQSGQNPTDFATAHQNSLMTQLQTEGAAAVMQSRLDITVANGIKDDLAAIFTQRGTKVGSPLDEAEKAVIAATAEREAAADACARLAQAAIDFDQASQTIKESSAATGALEADLVKTQNALLRVGELRTLITNQTAAETSMAADLERELRAHNSIIEVAAKIETHLTPRRSAIKNTLAAALEAEANARRLLTDAESICARAVEQVRKDRLACDLADLNHQRIERSATVKHLETRAASASAMRKQASELPAVTKTQLKELEKLNRQREKLSDSLDAISTRLEVMESDQVIAANDELLTANSPLTFSHDMVITVGEKTRLRITPGGGTTLTDARTTLSEVSAKLQRALDEVGCPSIAAAESAVAHLAEIAVRLEGFDTVEQELSEARARLLELDGRIARQKSADSEAPLDLAQATAQQLESRNTLEASMATEASAKGTLNALLQSLESAIAATQRATSEFNQTEKDLAVLAGQRDLLIETHGHESVRLNKLATLREQKSALDQALATSKQSLNALQPEILESDEKRLKRAIQNNQSVINDARQLLAVATSQLHREGTNDPHADLREAEAAEAAAHHRLAAARRHAAALQLLDRLFSEARQQLTDQFTRPLCDKVSGYLGCLFGHETAIRIVFEGGAFSALTLIRPGPRAFEFSDLSGGTQEQTAIAFRLAMAEILAADHDGSLPIFLDDAFTNSDPIRVAALQRMLDLAASRGLQVIVLSCCPHDYAALGAKTILLQSVETGIPTSSPIP